MIEREGKQHVILCEGFDDRSFWSGWLQHLGCTDPTDRGKKTARDAWGRPVKGKGRYLFRTPAGSRVVVQPFDGRDNAAMAVADVLQKQAQRPQRLILNLDSDADNGSGENARKAIRRIAELHGGSPVERSDVVFRIDAVEFFSVIWECNDPDPTHGIPSKQTLERLVTAAIRSAYPDRAPAVESWLEAEPRASVIPKSYGYSYLAKWYAGHGADDFFRQIWRDETVAKELRRRLEASGAWSTVTSLASD